MSKKSKKYALIALGALVFWHFAGRPVLKGA
jgi:hypothetical protein